LLLRSASSKFTAQAAVEGVETVVVARLSQTPNGDR